MSSRQGPLSTPGPLLFARYAYPPNALGFCGSEHPRELLEYGNAGVSDGGLAEAAKTFEGAWPYLELIASANHISDPLDARVVEAYWVGNRLLDSVRPSELARHVDERFRGRIGRTRERIVAAIAAGAVPHHCFHVFAVYPWVGLMRTGVVEQPLRILDRCRIAPAVVQSVGADGSVTVISRPLLWLRGMLVLGDPEPRAVRWQADGLGFVTEPAPGEYVSLHWDFVCDRVSPRAAGTLLAANRRAIAAVNRAGTPAAVL